MKYRMGIMTDFSIGQSLLTNGRVIESAKKMGLEKIVVADDMTISSLISLQKAAQAEGIEAMVGVKFRCYENPTYRKAPGEKMKSNPYFAVKVFPKTEEGLKTIFKILTRANTEERYYYNPRGCVEDLKDLRECVVTSGDLFGISKREQVEEVINRLDASCDFFTEICPVHTPLWDEVNAERLYGVNYYGKRVERIVVSYPALYQTFEEADSLPVLKAVCTNTQVASPFLPRQWVQGFALERPYDLHEDVKVMLERIVKKHPTLALTEIKSVYTGIEAVEFNSMPFYKFEHHAPCLPKMADDEFAEVVRQCKEGWNKRLFEERLGYKPDASMLPTYRDRLAYELGVIKKMGFAGYFLVVSDLVNWSKTNGVKVGCGRGSAGGSLIAYLMGITEVDPIRFDLVFERFINPARVDLPDVDLDYQSSKRSKVIEYLRNRYGEDRVAGISNYGTLASASAFRDTGRVFGLTPLDMTATKLVPKDAGFSYTLTEAAEAVPEIDKLKADYPEVWKHALRFEGVMRSLGQHAAGTVVAGEPLVNRAVVEKRAEGNVVNWDKRVVEDCGLIKMDILGLSTLDVLDIAQQYIKKRHGIDLDYLKLPLDDAKVLDAFGRGDTTAVFQFDSQGMQDLLRRLAKGGSLTFDDISAATALYRPGPLDSGLTDDYVAIKQGLKAPHYDHPAMRPALRKTNGVMVYQEQVMQVSRDVAGFSMAEADLLRKAIGKKDLKKMQAMKEKFIEGAIKTVGMAEGRARQLFEKIENFAKYSFNASHSVAYSIVSYWTCYLKVYYPAEYFAAQLSIVKEDKYPALVKDARSCGIDVLPPDVNLSTDKFEIKDARTIVAPFSSVKGCSALTAQKIMKAREEAGHFITKMHFEEYAKRKGSGINVRVVANLDAVGAFASIEPSQPTALDERRRKDQVTLMPGLIIDTITSSVITPMTEQKRLEIVAVHSEVLDCKACDLSGNTHCLPTVGGSKCRFVCVFDCPSWEEEQKGQIFYGKGATFMKSAMKENEISPKQGFYTALVRAKKSDKHLSNAQINGCSKFLDKEIELLKPGVIVCLGSASAKHFLPSLKAPSAEIGNAFYRPDLDATVVIGFNPLQCVFDPSKLSVLNLVFAKVAEVLSVKAK